MKKIIFILFFLCFIYADINSFLLKDLYDTRTNWELYSLEEDGASIFEGRGLNDDLLFIKIEKQIDYDKERIFEVLKDIENYNKIISNHNIFSDLVQTKSDTILGHQLITNVVPFIRNRQYVFKMYMFNDSRLDWILIDSENPVMEYYRGKNVHNLYYGAGSWALSSDNILSYRMYIDEEVNLPSSFIKRIKINSTLNIFNDVLNCVKKNKGK